MDEVAAALNHDPVEFRLKHLKAPRDIAVIKAAVEKAGWQTRPSPQRDQSGNTVSGRGMAYSQRGGTLVAIVAEVEIDRTSGRIWATQVHRRPRLRPDHQSRRPAPHDRGQHRAGHQPHAVGGGQVRPEERHQHRLDDLSDPRHHRDAGDDRRRADQPARDRARGRRRAVDPRRSRRRSRMRSSTRPACASAACRSRPTACKGALS